MNHRRPGPSRCADAVILIPGLMGSRLVDADGNVVWGIRPRLLARQLTRGDVLQRLKHAPGDTIRPDGLLQFPALIPGLGSLDPYRRLTAALRDRILTHPAALRGFAYDWRQPIERSARQLAPFAEAHLRAWRAHPDGTADARLWLIGHSLGGLVARYFTDVLDGRAITYQTITLATPHHGSLRALAAIANGDVLKLAALADDVRGLARTLPSLHELCPGYACLTTSPGRPPRRLRPADLHAIGADPEHAATAAATHALLRDDAAGAPRSPVRALVGINQPTAQTATLHDATLALHEHIDDEDRAGDGTVYRDAAAPVGVQADYRAQRHGRLASAPETIDYVHAVLTDRPLGPPMSARDQIGIDVAPLVAPHEPVDVRVIAEPDRLVHCHATDADSGRPAGVGTIATPAGDALIARLTLPRPGIYTIHATAGGASPVGEHVLCAESS